MTDNDKLVKLLLQGERETKKKGFSNCFQCLAIVEYIADYLLSNGVIVLPCKVGDKVLVDDLTWGISTYYENEFIHSRYFLVGEIISFHKSKKQFLMKIRVPNSTIHTRCKYKKYTINAIGKTVFLTREEAEAKLKESEQNDRE